MEMDEELDDFDTFLTTECVDNFSELCDQMNIPRKRVRHKERANAK